jgi:hypothetical protein
MDDSSKKEYEKHLKQLGYTTEYNPNAGQKVDKKITDIICHRLS